MKNTLIVALIFTMSALAGCRNPYYSTMETFGYHKRDLLVSRGEDARDAQQDAKEQFKSALESSARLQPLRATSSKQNTVPLEVLLEIRTVFAKMISI